MGGAVPSLSVKELQAIDLASRGLVCKEAARRMGLSPGRVRNVLARARAKTGTTNTTHLVAWCFRHGLLG